MSMATQDAKNQKTAIIVFSILFAIAYLLWIVPSGLYSHYYFTQASTVWKVIGFLSIAVHYYYIWAKFRSLSPSAGDKGSPAWILFGWFGLNLCLLSGFVFDLPPGA